MEDNNDEFEFESDDEEREFEDFYEQWKESEEFEMQDDVLNETNNIIKFVNYISDQFDNGKKIIEIPEEFIKDKNLKIYATRFGNIILN